MRRFLILNLLALLVAGGALACGYWGRPHYYVYSVFNRNQMNNVFGQRMFDFWKQYVGSEADYWDMEGLSWVNLDEFESSQNDIVKTAVSRGDTEMCDYLRLLIGYIKNVNRDEDAWEYPTKAERREADARMRQLVVDASRYNGTRLRPQYTLLHMRGLMACGDNKGIIDLWNSKAKRLPESVYRDMMKDIYAGALLRTGDKRQACAIYTELGDMQSLKWILRDRRGLQAIKEEYADDPNAPTLPFLVQDLVNSAQDTYSNLKKPELYEFLFQPGDIEAFNNDMKAFVDFALDVVRQERTKSPAMWMSAAGMVNSLAGHDRVALEQLDKAQRLKGTQRMIDNARACRLIASTATADVSKNYLDYVNRELAWLQQVEKTEQGDAGFENGANHYTEVMERLVYDDLGPKLKQLGREHLYLAMLGWMACHENGRDVTEARSRLAVPRPNSDYGYAVDSLTAEQMIDYAAYVKAKPATDLERTLLVAIELNDEAANDLIGTKFIRQGQFADAIPYLEKVTTAFISEQGISKYMAARDYTQDRWFGRQVVDRDDGDWSDWGTAQVKSNQKLDYCRSVLELQNSIDDAQDGEQALDAAYRLASLYYQASYKGDCWYLARYGQSVNDTICYRNEFDFIGQAVEWLEHCSRLTERFDLKQRALYALAFIPYGAPYITYTYDENYNQLPHYNRLSHEYRALLELSRFYQANRRAVAPYVSKCDVLRTFMASR